MTQKIAINTHDTPLYLSPFKSEKCPIKIHATYWEWPELYTNASFNMMQTYSFEDIYNCRILDWDVDSVNTIAWQAEYIEEIEKKEEKIKKDIMIISRKHLEKAILVNKLRRWETAKIEVAEWYIEMKYEGKNNYFVILRDRQKNLLCDFRRKYKYEVLTFIREFWYSL